MDGLDGHPLTGSNGNSATGRVRRKSTGTKTKTLPCPHCQRLFARLEHLQRHVRTHTKEKPFGCNLCGKSFARSDLLVRHERLVHPTELAERGSQTKSHGGGRRTSHALGYTQQNTHPPASLHAPQDPMDMGQVPPHMISPESTHPHDGQMQHDQEQSIEGLVDPALMGSPDQSMKADLNQHPSNVLGAQQLDPSWGYDLNLLSHAASHVALSGQVQGQLPPEMHQQSALQPHNDAYGSRISGDGYETQNAIFDGSDLADPMQDFGVFLDSVGLASDWHQGMFTGLEQHNQMPSPNMRFDQLGTKANPSELSAAGRNESAQDVTSFSRYGSRLPSLQPEDNIEEKDNQTAEDLANMKSRPIWEISNSDREQFISKLEDFVSVLPKSFVAPSRHSLSRYLAGYINGFHEHLPFIHVPTLNVAESAPELVLALAAVGAQYRFENARGIELFYASKAVAMEQIRRRDGTWLPQSDPHRSDSMSGSPGSNWQAISQPDSGYGYTAPTPIYSASDSDARMEIIRALLLLTAFATWERHRELLREALAFQSILARLVREAGLSESEPSISPDDVTWERWIKREGDKRTKLVVYCFFNLHSIAWNVPPLVLNAEVRLELPEPADEWKAANSRDWARLHQSNLTTPLLFQDALARLFSRHSASDGPTITPLGNYVLIHALIQQIFFARQLVTSWPGEIGTSLRPDDLNALEGALGAWKAGWKRTPESSLDPQNPNGPIAFTSTALLGLAYIRLHLDLGPGRHLESRDPVGVATALHESPPLQRSPRLIMALLHSAHALSIPVRLGIDFVAKTQTFFWSIQHSLCSLECAFLLSKWLAAIPPSTSQQHMPLSEHERKLLLWVRSMLAETDLTIAANVNEQVSESQMTSLENDANKMKQLSISVVRVWAKTFKGNTSWAIVDLIGSSLELYADMLEKDPM